ncbi:MAG: hypothetical protein ACFB5Z_14305 [Elainellaceae cyanobacterium]
MRPPSHRLPRSSPYRWAIGAQHVSPGQTVDNRYIVISPNIWRDTQLGHPSPKVEMTMLTADGDIADSTLGALRPTLVPYHGLKRLRYAAIQSHLPALDTVVTLDGKPIPLLRGGLDLVGQPYPTLYSVWKQATSAQQLSWLWQLCTLWEALAAEGVATSLLQANNLRVDGDRLCLLSLVIDSDPKPTSAALGRLWLPWTTYAGAIAAPLQRIAQQLQSTPSPQGLFFAEYQLNRWLLQTAAQPFTVRAAQATRAVSSAPLASYGATAGLPLAAVCCRASAGSAAAQKAQPAAENLASQLVQALVLQVKVMGEELDRCGLLSPRWVVPQISAMVRVLNNILSSQETDERLSLAFAIAVPQPIPPADEVTEPPDQGPETGQQNSPSTAQEIYAFTTGACFIYQMRHQVWRRVVPIKLQTASFLGEQDGLKGQIQRLIVDTDQLLLLSSYPLDDLINQRQQAALKALESDEVDLDAIAQWVMSKTTSQGNVAIALMHHQSPVSAVASGEIFGEASQAEAPAEPPQSAPQPTPEMETARPTIADIEASAPQVRPRVQPPVVPSTAAAAEPAPPADSAAANAPPGEPLVTESDFRDDEVDTAAFEDVLIGGDPAQPARDDSISRYIDAEVRPPQPAFNTILDQDIDQGLSTLISARADDAQGNHPARPGPPQEEQEKPREKKRREKQIREKQAREKKSREKKRRDAPQREKSRRSLFKRKAPKTPPRRTASRQTQSRNRGRKARTARRRRPQNRPLLILMFLVFALAATSVALLWQHNPERFEQWLPPRQE